MKTDNKKKTKNKTALVTGATGFVGSHLASRLIKDGWNVHVITRPTSDVAALKNISGPVIFHQHNGRAGNMIDIVNKSDPLIIFHLASFFLSQHKPLDIERLIQSNIVFGTQLLEAMSCCSVNYFVNTGTSWEHYQHKKYSPVNLYAATKQAFEAVLRYYVEAHELNTITIKLFDTYGPNDTRPKLLNLLKEGAKEGKPLSLSPGEQLLDIVYIDDVVDLFMLTADRLLAGQVEQHEVYAASSGHPIKLKDFVNLYGRATGNKVEIKWGGRSYRDREVFIPWNKGKLFPGWVPKVSLEDGLKKKG